MAVPDYLKRPEEEEVKPVVFVPNSENNGANVVAPAPGAGVPVNTGNDNSPILPAEQPYVFKSPYQEAMEKGTPASVETPGGDGADAPEPTAETPAYGTSGAALTQYLTDLNKFLTPPETQDERARRERAATAIGGVGALGNALSGLSNLIGTANKAAPQKQPENYDANKGIQDFRKQQDELAQRYLAGSGQKLAAIRAAEQDALTQKWKEQELGMKRAKLQSDLAANEQKIAQLRAQAAKATNEAEKAACEAEIRRLEALNTPMRLTLENDKTQAQTSQYRASANASNTNARSTRAKMDRDNAAEKVEIAVSGGEPITIHKNDRTENNAAAILQANGINVPTLRKKIHHEYENDPDKNRWDEKDYTNAMLWETVGAKLTEPNANVSILEQLSRKRGYMKRQEEMPGVNAGSGSGNSMPGV